jgi:hypothetical protein
MSDESQRENIDMRTASIQAAGILLTRYVDRLNAESRLRGVRANNTVHYYNCEKGIYDGIATCLETIAERSGLPSFRESVDDAAEQMRQTDPARENPEDIPNITLTFVYLIGALIVAEGEPSWDK